MKTNFSVTGMLLGLVVIVIGEKICDNITKQNEGIKRYETMVEDYKKTLKVEKNYEEEDI